MKQISDPQEIKANNAWGRASANTVTKYAIEAHDVGITRPNHRGFGHSKHTFTRADVGKTISVYVDGTGWTCWVFDL